MRAEVFEDKVNKLDKCLYRRVSKEKMSESQKTALFKREYKRFNHKHNPPMAKKKPMTIGEFQDLRKSLQK